MPENGRSLFDQRVYKEPAEKPFFLMRLIKNFSVQALTEIVRDRADQQGFFKELLQNKMTRKKLLAEIYLENGEPICGMGDACDMDDAATVARFFNNCGVDILLVSDLTHTDQDKSRDMHALREICNASEIPVYGSGKIENEESAVNLLRLGCDKVVFDSSAPDFLEVARQFSDHFGKERAAVLLHDQAPSAEELEKVFSEFLLNGKAEAKVTTMLEIWSDAARAAQENEDLALTLLYDLDSDERLEETIRMFREVSAFGISRFADLDDNVMRTKKYLREKGIPTGHMQADMEFSELKTDEKGLVPAIVQDYKTGDVLMLAYMNAESYEETLSTGHMTYFSRSRQSLWMKGETSGHFQYVKALKIDCDKDTILAKVSQVGAACHTGHRSCFYRNLAETGLEDKNPIRTFRDEYLDVLERMNNMKDLLL